MLAALLGPIIGGVIEVIKEAVPDKDKQAELTAKLTNKIYDLEKTTLQGQIDIIKAEALASGPAASWRPHLMYFLMFLIAYMVVAKPIVKAVWGVDLPVLDAFGEGTEQIWELLKIGMGGYIIGRSGEKMMSMWKNGK